MTNLITGLVAVILIAMFLGHYAITLNSWPLWIIIIFVVLLIGVDYLQSLRSQNGTGDS